MDDKRNLITAILLSVLILIGWNYAAAYFFPEVVAPAKPTPTAAPASGPLPAADSGELGAPPPTAGSATAAPALGATAPAKPQSVNAALAASPRVPLRNAKVTGSINLVGARVDDISLTNHRVAVERTSAPVRLFAPASTAGATFASVGWTGAAGTVPDASTLWQADRAELTPTSPLTLSWDNGAGQLFQIRFQIDNDYLITATKRVENRAAAAVPVASYAFINRRGVPKLPEDADTWTAHSGPMGHLAGATNYDWDYDDIRAAPGGAVSFAGQVGGWIGFSDKYWLAAVAPGTKERVTAAMRTGSGDLFQTNFARAAANLAPGAAASDVTRIFAGAKEVAVLDDYTNRLGITRLSHAIDWGWFDFFARPIFAVLDWLYRLVGNFGVAIMALTLIIRLALFPIAQKQFHSMAQMKIVQPKMKAIQDRYKDDKPKQQQELMKLYKDEKINPLAGCLPIVIQIPIFYALYKVLILTIEMRHQPFLLWIKDLSVPDPAMVLNLFGLLPWTPPAILGIGVLAIILGVTMWLQFRLNPAPTDPIQQQVFAIMPWMFMFIMAPFAAGLLLYWVTNNILSIAQQQWMYRQFPALKAAPIAAK